MDNKGYTGSVEHEKFPEEPFVPLGSSFVDDRGVIQNLLHTPINSVAIITSKAGTERSNHWHKTDFHYLYVMDGEMEYWERNIDGSNVKSRIFKAGQMFFTPPKKVHKVKFIKDTTLLSFSRNVRDHEHHEEDVVREKF
jgi:quercetin dioxygenase-like cupin family protein